MKIEVANFMARCPNCQQVNVEHQGVGGLTQNLHFPTSNWEDVNMDFVLGFPCTCKQHDSIWDIVDRFSKSSHFIPVKVSY